jgi:hypothetical protein
MRSASPRASISASARRGVGPDAGQRATLVGEQRAHRTHQRLSASGGFEKFRPGGEEGEHQFAQSDAMPKRNDGADFGGGQRFHCSAFMFAICRGTYARTQQKPRCCIDS